MISSINNSNVRSNTQSGIPKEEREKEWRDLEAHNDSQALENYEHIRAQYFKALEPLRTTISHGLVHPSFQREISKGSGGDDAPVGEHEKKNLLLDLPDRQNPEKEALASPLRRKRRAGTSTGWLSYAIDNFMNVEDDDTSGTGPDSSSGEFTKSETSSETASQQEEDEEGDDPYVPPEGDQRGIERYFKIWTVASVVLFVVNVANMNWKLLVANEPWWMIMLSVMFLTMQGALQWSVLELPLMSLAAVLVKSVPDQIGNGRHLTVVINYNLLASERGEVDAAMGNAYTAYVGNLSPSVVAVLVSATGDEDLKRYELEVRDHMREEIFDLVLHEGTEWAKGNAVDKGRANRVFEIFRDQTTGQIPPTFVESVLPGLAQKYAKEFMVIQRVTRGRLPFIEMNTVPDSKICQTYLFSFVFISIHFSLAQMRAVPRPNAAQ